MAIHRLRRRRSRMLRSVLAGIRAATTPQECRAAGGIVKKPPEFASPETARKGFVCALPPSFSRLRRTANLAQAPRIVSPGSACPPGLPVKRRFRNPKTGRTTEICFSG